MYCFRKHRTRLFALGIWLSVICFSLMAVSEDVPKLLNASKHLLAHSVGNADPALPRRLATRLNPDQLVAAFYHGSRIERLVALDVAATGSDDPFFLAPSLASLMGAADRQVASMAARALFAIVRAAVSRPDGLDEVIPKRAAQLTEQLRNVAVDRRLDLDVRQIAIQLIEPLQEKQGIEERGDWALDMLDDEESAIRRQALGVIYLPLSEPAVSKVLKVATQDTDLLTRGDAAVLLCENAVAHRVSEPSADLVDLLQSTIQTPKIPVDVLGGILSCLSEFTGAKRETLLDLVTAHPDPAVKQYWNQLKTK